jgi:hypothetical protein
MAAPSAGTAYVEFEGRFDRLGKQLAAQSGPLSRGGRKLGVAVGAGIGAGLVGAAGLGKALYNVGVQFDDAYDKIRVGTGRTGKQLRGLRKDFKSVVKDVPTDFGSASTAVTELNRRLGVTGRPLRRLSGQLLELSRITDTDLGENIASVTRLFGDWSIKTGQQEKTLDRLFRVSQASGIQVAELSRLMVQFGSPLRQLGLGFDFTAAMFARFEKEGVNIQTAMPGLRMALKNFAKDGKEPAPALRETFRAIREAGSTAKANTIAFDTFGARAGPDLAAAVREGRFDLDKLIGRMRSGRDTIRGAARDTEDFTERWQRFKNRAMVQLEPIARRVFDSVAREAEGFFRVLNNPRLTTDEKLDRVMRRAGDLLERAIPQVADRIGQAAPQVARAFINGFLNAGLWGQLVIGGLLLRKIGGLGALTALGARMGTALRTGMAGPMSRPLPAPTVAGAPGKGGGGGAPVVAPVLRGGAAASAAGTVAGTAAVVGGIKAISDAVKGAVGSDLGLLNDFAGQLERVARVGDAPGMRSLAAKLRETAAANQGFTKGEHLKAFADALDHAASSGGRDLSALKAAFRSMGKSTGGDLEALRKKFGEMGKGTNAATGDIRLLSNEYARSVRGMRIKTGRDFGALVDKVLEGSREMLRRGGRNSRETREEVERQFDIARRRVKQAMDQKIISVEEGTRRLKQLARRELGLYGISAGRVNVVLARGANGQERPHQQGGFIVPGQGSGDKVRRDLPVGSFVLNREATDAFGFDRGGMVPTVLEPRERVFLPDEVKRIGLEQLKAMNAAVPRFQQGGPVQRFAHGGAVPRNMVRVPGDPDTTGGRDRVNRAIVNQVAAFIRRFGIQIGYAYDPGHHQSPGHNETGTDLDIHPHTTGWDGVDRAVAAAVRAGKKVLYDGRFGSIAYPNHGRGHHAHIEWGMGGAAARAARAVFEGLRRVVLQGPPSVALEAGQGALDRIHSAANVAVERAIDSSMGAHGPASAPTAAGAMSEGEFIRIALQALRMTEHFPATAENARRLLVLARQESSLIPSSVNNWDSNAKAGNPSGGLMHTTLSTFRTYHEPGTANTYFDPLASIAASINYQKARYGRLVTHSPYRLGGLVELLRGFAGGGPVDRAGDGGKAKGKRPRRTLPLRIAELKKKLRLQFKHGYPTDGMRLLDEAVGENGIAERMEKDLGQLRQRHELTEEEKFRPILDAVGEQIGEALNPDGYTDERGHFIGGIKQHLDELAAEWRLAGGFPGAAGLQEVYQQAIDRVPGLRGEIDAGLAEREERMQLIAKLARLQVQRRQNIEEAIRRLERRKIRTAADRRAAVGDATEAADRDIDGLGDEIENLEQQKSATRSKAEKERLDREIRERRERIEDIRGRVRRLRGRDSGSDALRLHKMALQDDLGMHKAEMRKWLGSTGDDAHRRDAWGRRSIAGGLRDDVRDRWRPAVEQLKQLAFDLPDKRFAAFIDAENIRKEFEDWRDTPTPRPPAGTGTEVDDSSARRAELLEGLLREANLRTAVSERQFAALPFGGSFSDGGFVPGPHGAPRMIEAHGGELVLNDNQQAALVGGPPVVHVHIANGMEWLRRFVRVETEGVTRRAARRAERRLPGAGGGWA